MRPNSNFRVPAILIEKLYHFAINEFQSFEVPTYSNSDVSGSELLGFGFEFNFDFGFEFNGFATFQTFSGSGSKGL